MELHDTVTSKVKILRYTKSYPIVLSKSYNGHPSDFANSSNGVKPPPSQKNILKHLARAISERCTAIELIGDTSEFVSNRSLSVLRYYGFRDLEEYILRICEICLESGEDAPIPVLDLGPFSFMDLKALKKQVGLVKISFTFDEAKLIGSNGVLSKLPRHLELKKTLIDLGKIQIPTHVNLTVGDDCSLRNASSFFKFIAHLSQKFHNIQSVSISRCSKPNRASEQDALFSGDVAIELIETARKALPKEIVIQYRFNGEGVGFSTLARQGVRDIGSLAPHNGRSCESMLEDYKQMLLSDNIILLETLPIHPRLIKRGMFPSNLSNRIKAHAQRLRKDISK